jgi:hypothetical protein
MTATEFRKSLRFILFLERIGPDWRETGSGTKASVRTGLLSAYRRLIVTLRKFFDASEIIPLTSIRQGPTTAQVNR